ncbi:hypothetical protein M9Y10_012721 [Tritrichomonas musculus]|uniref:Uncharacterized protein n=1 Tax=Tritrichomonas musculus TaxID=1915356 RepID=A0ABR2IDA8_9EUKA
MSSEIVVLWDCRAKCQKPIEVWKSIVDTTKGVKPTSLLILQPPNCQIPQPLQTVMRMTNTKMFVGNDAVEFAFLELCLSITSYPGANIILVTDDLVTFVRPFRLNADSKATIITSSQLPWPLNQASWTKSLRFLSSSRKK